MLYQVRRMMRLTATRLLPIFVALLCGSAWAVNIVLDPAKQVQTIEGLGAFGPQKLWWGYSPSSDAWVDLIINDLGLTMSRDEIYPEFESSNENTDPNVTDLTKFNYTLHTDWYKQMKAKADAAGEPWNLLASVWTPPAWMKTNGSLTNGGSLRPEMNVEMAEFFSAYCKVVKRDCGFYPYAISLQNEPSFAEPYNSCLSNAEQMLALLRAVGPRFVRDGIPTKILMPEEMLSDWMGLKGRIDKCGTDTAGKYMSIIAYHGYDGGGVNPAATDINALKAFAALSVKYKAGAWMSETSGGDETGWGAFAHAKGLFNGLKYGRLTGWTYWYMSDRFFNPGGSTSPTKLYYCMKSFYKYIRPGAIHLDAVSDNPDVQAVAFGHPTKKTLTYVIINNTSSAATVNLSGPGLPATFKAFRTSSGENFATLANVSATGINAPASSITTLSGTGFNFAITDVGSAPETAPRQGASAIATRVFTRSYDLRGRITSADRTHGATAVRVLTPANGAGTKMAVVR